MTKRAPKKSPAAQSLARKRWDAVPKSKRAGVNAAATAARWPKCSICGEREGHSVHACDRCQGELPCQYHHPFEK